MHLYVAPWEWFTDPAGRSYWRAPGGGSVGALDLRSVPAQGTPVVASGVGAFAYPAQRVIAGGVYLGEDFDAPLSNQRRNALSGLLGRTVPSGTTPRSLLWDALTTNADPEGLAGPLPVIGHFGGTVRLDFGGSLLREEAFTGAHVTRAVAVFRSAYARVRALGESPVVLQKWTARTNLELFGTLGDDVLAPEFKADGWRLPETTFTESFPSVSVTISSGQDQTWTEVTNNMDVQVKGSFNCLVSRATGDYASARCETALSSADHYMEGSIVYNVADNNHLSAICVRFDSSADTCYFAAYWNSDVGNNVVFGKRVTGTNTFLTDAVLTDPSANTPYKLKLASQGSSHSVYVDDVQYITSFSDSAISSGVRIGALQFTNNDAETAVHTVTGSDDFGSSGSLDVAVSMSGLGYNLAPLYPNAPVFKLAGTQVVSATAATIGWPATVAVGDVGILMLETAAQASTLTTASGFVEATNSPQTTGTAGATNAVALQVFWARAASTTPASVVAADAGDHVIGRILTFSNVATAGNPWDQTAGNVQGTATTVVSIASLTTTIPNTLVVPVLANHTDSTTSQATGWANAALAGFAEIADANTNTAQGGGLSAAAGTKDAAGGTGTVTATLASASKQAFITLALRPQPVHQGFATPPLGMLVAPEMSGTGTVTEGGFTGTGAMSVAPSMSGTGLVGIIGTAAMAVAVAMSGTGALTFTGTGATEVPVAMSGTGVVGNIGTGSLAVAPEMSGSGLVVSNLGSGAMSVSVEMAATGTQVHTGAGAMDVAVSMSASGLAGYIGTGSLTVAPSVAATGELSYSGSASMLVAPELSGAATLSFTGSAAMTVAVEMAATGTNTANNGITGTGELLVAPSLSATGSQTNSGSGAVEVVVSVSGSGLVGSVGTGAMEVAVQMSGTGNIPTIGTAAMFVAPEVSGTGIVGNVGTGSLDVPLSVAASGSQTNSGTGSLTVAVEMAASGAVANIVGSGSMSVAVEVAATGTLEFTGSGSLTVAPQLAATATLSFDGSGALVVSPEMSGSGNAANPISGTGAVIVPVVLAGTGEVTFLLIVESLTYTPNLTVDLEYTPNLLVDLTYS